MKNLLNKIFVVDPDSRIELDEIMSHPAFYSVNWNWVENKESLPPFQPSQFFDIPQYEKYELARDIIKETPREKSKL